MFSCSCRQLRASALRVCCWHRKVAPYQSLPHQFGSASSPTSLAPRYMKRFMHCPTFSSLRLGLLCFGEGLCLMPGLHSVRLLPSPQRWACYSVAIQGMKRFILGGLGFCPAPQAGRFLLRCMFTCMLLLRANRCSSAVYRDRLQFLSAALRLSAELQAGNPKKCDKSVTV